MCNLSYIRLLWLWRVPFHPFGIRYPRDQTHPLEPDLLRTRHPLEGTWDQATRKEVTPYTPCEQTNITFPQIRWRTVLAFLKTLTLVFFSTLSTRNGFVTRWPCSTINYRRFGWRKRRAKSTWCSDTSAQGTGFLSRCLETDIPDTMTTPYEPGTYCFNFKQQLLIENYINIKEWITTLVAQIHFASCISHLASFLVFACQVTLKYLSSLLACFPTHTNVPPNLHWGAFQVTLVMHSNLHLGTSPLTLMCLPSFTGMSTNPKLHSGAFELTLECLPNYTGVTPSLQWYLATYIGVPPIWHWISSPLNLYWYNSQVSLECLTSCT